MCQFSLIKFRFWTVISAHILNIYSLSYPLSMHISATYVGSLLPIFILSLFLTRKEWFSYMQTEWYKQQKREKSKPIKVKFIHIFCLAFRLKNFFIKNIIARYGWWVGNDLVQRREKNGKSVWEKNRISSSLYSTSSKLSLFSQSYFSIKKKNLNFYDEKTKNSQKIAC